MKKFYIFSCISICALILAFLLVGCGSQNNNISENISDARYGVFDGKNDQLYSTFIYGERENPYNPDGISNEKVNFGILSISFINKQKEESLNFSLKSENKTYTGKIEKSPFTDEYLADIGNQIISDTPLELTLELPSGNIILNLEKKSSDWQIDYYEALNIGEEGLKDKINDMSKDGQMEYQLKIISNNKAGFGKYFWAFTAISQSGEKHTVIFSPDDKTILVKN